jgi:hypothetical protein
VSAQVFNDMELQKRHADRLIGNAKDSAPKDQAAA